MRDIQQALRDIPDFDDRQIWLRVGMALYSTGDPRARAWWDKWSKQSERFDLEGQDTAWRSFDNPHSNPVTLGTLFYLAKRKR